MVETELTPDLIREGAALIEQLDRQGASPDGALWLYDPDTGSWKLMLVEMKVGPRGPREVYRVVQNTLRKLRNQITHLSLEDVAVAKPDALIVRMLTQAIGTGPGVYGMRFSRNVVGGVPIEDAYIYRLGRSSA